jgi:aminoglycoside 6-adenylyltransferase
MMDLIIGTAAADERVRAVCMNGSRVNPAAQKDKLQDYDIVYFVTELAVFTADHTWVDLFGDRTIMQLPDEMSIIPGEPRRCFTYLMQFEDGNRIDLTLSPLEDMEDCLKSDSLTLVLLDKDGVAPALPPPGDSSYHVKPPNEKLYQDCCNEFWWLCPYIAKGLWRGQFLYAAETMNQYLRPMLHQMLRWQVGTEHNFAVNTGKGDHAFSSLLSEETWDKLVSTYRMGSCADIWAALRTSRILFRRSANAVAAHFGWQYNGRDDERVSAYVDRIHAECSE